MMQIKVIDLVVLAAAAERSCILPVPGATPGCWDTVLGRCRMLPH